MTSVELLARYSKLGLKLLYWPRVGDDPKTWKGPTSKGWNDPSRAYPLDAFDPAIHNLGFFNGCETPAGFAHDVDLDWAEGLDLVPKLIPSTAFAFGRKGKKLSHAIFTTSDRLDGVIKYTDFDDATGKGDTITFVELRGGDHTHQTMIAPSLHSPGVTIELVLNGAILHVDLAALKRAVLDYAVGCIILRRMPGGLHHDGRQALAGFLLNAGLAPERVVAIIESICAVQVSRGVTEMTAKDVADAELVVRSSVKRKETGKKVVGGPTLAEIVGGTVGKALLARLNKWLGREDVFVRDANGKILTKSQENIRIAVAQLGHVLTYDEFSERKLLDGALITDGRLNKMYLDIDATFRFQPHIDFFRLVVDDTCLRNQFHPVRQYLDALKWDGVPRVDEWLIRAGGVEDSEYTRAVSSIMLIAGVRRIRSPGCKYDEMVIWESPTQGTEKSSAAAALCPKVEWFSDDLPLNVGAKELIERTLGKWIIEASDLSGKRKTENEQLKSMLSRQVDGPARMAYARSPVERARQFLLVGTSNEFYHNDSTGARRFWPLAITRRFDVAWIRKHRDQLWAEASAREASGESIRLHEDLWPAAGDQQEKRREIDPWEATIRNLLLNIAPGSGGKRRIAADDLWTALGIMTERRERVGQLRISAIMRRFGFKRTNVRTDEGVVTGYVTVDPSALAVSELEDADAEDVETSVETKQKPPF